jgi:hypothetical protein
MEDGQEVLDPSTGMVYGNFIAIFLIASRESRAEAIRLGNLVERVVREHTDGFKCSSPSLMLRILYIPCTTSTLTLLR